MPFLADVPRARAAELRLHPFGLVDVAAEEVFGLALLDEIAHRRGARVLALTDAVERCALGWRVADEDERIEFGKTLQPVGELSLRKLAGRVEGRRVGVAKAGHVPAADLEMALMQVVQAVARAHTGDLVCRLVVAGEHIDLATTPLQDLATAFDAACPRDLIAGRDIKISLHAEQVLERLPVRVDVGKDEEFHAQIRE